MKTLLKLTLLLCLFTLCNIISAKNYVNIKNPVKWKLAGPIPRHVKVTETDIPKAIAVKSLCIEGVDYKVKDVVPEQGTVDFVKLFYKTHDKKIIAEHVRDAAILFTEIDVPEDGELLIGAGADWWMEWYLDGKSFFSTMRGGNGTGRYGYTNHVFSAKVAKGKHILVVKVASGSAGWLLKYAFGATYNKELADLKVKYDQKIKQREELRKHFKALVKKNSKLKIAAYGSSVAKGAGAEEEYGWANRLGTILKKNNWDYVNKSVGGDTTEKLLARIHMDLLPEKPDVVIIGLSLANEGIRGEKDPIYKQYVRNMRKLIQVLRKNGIVPMISNCYPHGAYSALEYAYVKKFNEELERWPVISFDFMGAVDNGKGQWVDGYWKDSGHPNDQGHQDMMMSIPPSVFDFYVDGCLAEIEPVEMWFSGMAASDDVPVMKFQTPYPMSSFTYGFDVTFSKPIKPGVIAAVNGNDIIITKNKTIAYVSDKGDVLDSEVSVEAGKKYQIALAYRNGLQKLSFFVNKLKPKSISQQIKPTTFTLGGGLTGNAVKCEFRNCVIYRSCKRTDQIKRIFNGVIGYSSLELFSPLNDGVVRKGLPLINKAPTSSNFIYLGSE